LVVKSDKFPGLKDGKLIAQSVIHLQPLKNNGRTGNVKGSDENNTLANFERKLIRKKKFVMIMMLFVVMLLFA
jgi:hypothetical protein